ncbi:M56 family metallopeptidase [Paraglaciecola sp. MB-3u-78]|jgi:bla regulator protein BlaR1|uniref:M56 family metallopeptidase n=1 Tax=Paraglaciecola sp. MB-3u-78 TaxID=2058332 RepID=UPI000C346FFD|nr:M56 family metallopeptidase [Paraglaciecola sp. MB-3u-78]PKG97531.1 energy transducer TonB [Paraglaciecola sp. MB-3u-78]
MSNWLIEQQIVISFLLLTLITLEAKAMKNLGAEVIYALWLLVPLLLIANNLPQDVITVDDKSIYRYIVEIGAATNTVNINFNWALLWLSGCLAILSLGAIAQWKIYRIAHFGSRKVELGIALPNTLTVVKNNQLSSPILSGIFKPTLLIPEGFHSQFSVRQQQLMINHELVHFHRGDNLYNLFALLFVAVFWFNPLTWLAYRAFRRSQELACDAAVLKQSTTEDQISYSKALVQCAERSLHSFSIYSPYGEKHTMFKRIINIQSPSKIKPALIGLSIALSSTLLASVAFANLAETAHSVDKPSMAIPVIRIEPKYPVEAARDNQEGSVILQFDITQDGSTDNIEVIESFPQQVFDKNAITALKQWTYKPRIQGGQAQIQSGLKVQLDFKLDKPYEGQTAINSSIEKI